MDGPVQGGQFFTATTSTTDCHNLNFCFSCHSQNILFSGFSDLLHLQILSNIAKTSSE